MKIRKENKTKKIKNTSIKYKSKKALMLILLPDM